MNFVLDPIGDPTINTVDLRTGSQCEYSVVMNKNMPNNSLDFVGKFDTVKLSQFLMIMIYCMLLEFKVSREFSI